MFSTIFLCDYHIYNFFKMGFMKFYGLSSVTLRTEEILWKIFVVQKRRSWDNSSILFRVGGLKPDFNCAPPSKQKLVPGHRISILAVSLLNESDSHAESSFPEGNPITIILIIAIKLKSFAIHMIRYENWYIYLIILIIT